MLKSRIAKRLLFGLLMAGHAVMLVLLSFFFMSTDYMHGDEAWIIKNTAAVLRTLLPEIDKPAREEFAFVNVSHDLALIPRLDADGFPAGNQVVTDRNTLAEFFEILNREPNWKLLFCDIFFADSTPDDTLLGPELQKLPNSLFSFHVDESGAAMEPVFKGITLGLADYYQVDDEFLKFRLVRDGHKTVPLQMFEILDGGTFEEGKLFWEWNGKPAFNDFILDFRIRSHDLFRDPPNYPYADLNFLMETARYVPEELHAFTKDRIIIVGDFDKYDLHETMYGEMAGPLILANLYLSLRQGDMQIPWGFPALLWAVFLVLSYILFTKADFFEVWVRRRISSNPFILLMAQGISYLVLLGLTSVLTFILFNYHFNFLFLTIYFNIVEWILKYRKRKRLDREAEATEA